MNTQNSANATTPTPSTIQQAYRSLHSNVNTQPDKMSYVPSEEELKRIREAKHSSFIRYQRNNALLYNILRVEEEDNQDDKLPIAPIRTGEDHVVSSLEKELLMYQSEIQALTENIRQIENEMDKKFKNYEEASNEIKKYKTKEELNKWEEKYIKSIFSTTSKEHIEMIEH